MKRAPARWEADNPAAYEQGTRSFWLNAFVSQWASWESIILKYLNAIGSTRKMQVVYNTCFGELWEDRGDLEDEDSLMARREEYPAELPEGVLVLTAGVDTQDDRMEYEIVGHGHFGETWGIEKGIVMGRPDDDAVWSQLDELVFDRVLRFENGVGLKMSMSFVDEGGHFTQEVRMQCRARLGKKVFCIKGMPGSDKPYTAPPKKQKIIIKQTAVGTCWQYQIGVDSGKEVIMDNLRVQTPGAKYCHFPKRDDYGSGYFTGLLSEVKVYDPNKKQPWQWKKIPGHERNEALDCRNYALAAFKALPKNLDEIDRRLKEAGGERAPPLLQRLSCRLPPPSRGRSAEEGRNTTTIGEVSDMDKVELRARLDFWQSALSKLRAAYLALVDGGVKSYVIDDRELTRFDLPDLKDEIEDAEKKVDELTAELNGRKPRKAFGIVPRDW